MKSERREANAAQALLVTALLSGAVCAQDYPSHPVRLISPNPAGGANDTIARIVVNKLTEVLGQQVVIDNRGGAAGTIGSDLAAKASPDGYTLLVGTSSTHAIAQSLYAKLPYDSVKDFTPVIGFATTTIVLSLHPSVPVKNVKEFIALAKAQPGKLNFATGGIGASDHMATELFMSMTGVKMVHVPYKGGGPAIVDLIAGNVDLGFSTMATAKIGRAHV